MPVLAFAYSPFWTLPGIAWIIVAIAVLLWGWRFADRKRKQPRCPKCRYDLSGHTTNKETAALPITCPECGRVIKKQRQLHKPKKRKSLIALAILFLIAASAFILHPEVREKGGWVFVARSTVMLVTLPHLEDPQQWDDFDEFDRRLAASMPTANWTSVSGRPTKVINPPLKESTWAWQRRLALSRAITTASGGQTDASVSAALRLLDFDPYVFDAVLPNDLKDRWLSTLVHLVQTCESFRQLYRVATKWPNDCNADPVTREQFVDALTKWESPVQDDSYPAGTLMILHELRLLDDRHIEAIRQLIRTPPREPRYGDTGDVASWGIEIAESLGPVVVQVSDDLLIIAQAPGPSQTGAIALLIMMGDLATPEARTIIMGLFNSSDSKDHKLFLEACGQAGPNSIEYAPEILTLLDSNTNFPSVGFQTFLAGWDETNDDAKQVIASGWSRIKPLYELIKILDNRRTARRIALVHALKSHPTVAGSLLSSFERLAANDPDEKVQRYAATAAAAIREAIEEQQ